MTPAEHHKALRKAKQELKRRLAVPCPHCAVLQVGPPPRMLLPQEMCKMHGYRDPRPRRPEDDYRRIVRRHVRHECLVMPGTAKRKNDD